MSENLPPQLKQHMLPDLLVLFTITYNVSTIPFILFPISYLGTLISKVIRNTYLKYVCISILFLIPSDIFHWILYGVGMHAITCSTCYFRSVKPFDFLAKIQMCTFLFSMLIKPSYLVKIFLTFLNLIILKHYYEAPLHEHSFTLEHIYNKICLWFGRTNYILISNECRDSFKDLYKKHDVTFINVGLIWMYLISNLIVKWCVVIGMILPFKRFGIVFFVFLLGYILEMEIICILASIFGKYVMFCGNRHLLAILLVYTAYNCCYLMRE